MPKVLLLWMFSQFYRPNQKLLSCFCCEMNIDTKPDNKMIFFYLMSLSLLQGIMIEIFLSRKIAT